MPAEETLQELKHGQYYRNTKTGDVYRLLFAAGVHTETGEKLAIYRLAAEDKEGFYATGDELFCRPYDMFRGKRADGRWYFEHVHDPMCGFFEAPSVGQ